MPALSMAESIALAPEEERNELLATFSDEELEDLLHEWRFWARPDQIAPLDFYIWLILAGRGWGKTRTGAECVIEWAKEPGIWIALVARTAADYRAVMIEGESGILACSPPDFRPHYEPSKRKLTWPNGTIAMTYSAEEPKLLRGPQHHKAWGDEIAAWDKEAGKIREDDPDSPFNNLLLGLRLGDKPQLVLTTTPRPTPRIKMLARDRRTVITTGNTYENAANVSQQFLEEIRERYEHSRLGRQEIYAQILDDNPGALWKRDFYQYRAAPELLTRVVVAIDPQATRKPGHETGIVAAGRAANGDGFVLADHSGNLAPREWARRAIDLAREVEADAIIGEGNNGGEMIEEVIRGALDEGESMPCPYEMIWASRGKRTRAEPVSVRYEQGKVFHVEIFNELEDQQCTWDPDEDPADSPDRLDASVWALTATVVGKQRQTFDKDTREILQGIRVYD